MYLNVWLSWKQSSNLHCSLLTLVVKRTNWWMLCQAMTVNTSSRTIHRHPFRQGMDIFIGRTFNELCPVAAVLSYLTRRGNNQGPLFWFVDGRLLTWDRLVIQVRLALSAASITGRAYAGHSFRIRATTAAGRCGLPPATMKTLGHWSSLTYLLYIFDSLESNSQRCPS